MTFQVGISLQTKTRLIICENLNSSFDSGILELLDQKSFDKVTKSIFKKTQFENIKGEDMQSTTKFLAYLRHNVLQRGDYIT